MLPWKLLFRFFSAMILMATGGFAAGHELPMPFESTPTPVAAASAPADPSTTTTTTAAPVDDSTTTTTAPDAPPPVVVDPVPDPVPPTTAPEPTTTTTAPKAVLTPADPAPVPPADGDGPAVCAAAQAAACAPVDAAAPDNNHAARVQRCQDWWNSLADAFTANSRPEWAARARELAGQCDAFITRWEQWEQKSHDWQARHPKDPRGDHNGDGHPDNGRGPKPEKHPTPPPAQPPAKQVSRHGEGRH